MASNINPTNIDGTYPIAGQDNDSQGFRDNFTNIRANFVYAKDEIDKLQANVIVKRDLTTGLTPTNDMAYAPIYRPQLKSPSIAFRDLGTLSGILGISFYDGTFQKVTTSSSLTLSLADFPAAGQAGTMRLWINCANTGHTVTFPQTVTLGTGNITGLNPSTKTLTFSAVGNYLFELTTVDGGSNFWIVRVA